MTLTPELTKSASRSQLMRGRRCGERELHVCPNTRNTGVGGSWLPGQPEEKRRAARKGMEKGEGMVRGGWAKFKEEEGKKDADERGKEGEGRAEQGRAGQGRVAGPLMVPRSQHPGGQIHCFPNDQVLHHYHS